MSTDNSGTPTPDNSGTPAATASPAASPAPQGTPAPASAPQGTPSPAGTPAPTTKPTGTVADGGKGAEPPAGAPAPQNFPDDWRQKLAGGDAKELARLERFGSPDDVWKAYRNIETKVSSGQLKSVAPLPDNATPEQLAEYRKANGIPETADKYDITLDKGVVIGEADKPMVDEFLKYAHDNNLTPASVKGNLQFYFDLQASQMAKMAEDDSNFKTESILKLKETWGGDYTQNTNRIKGLIDMFPAEDMANLLTGKTADGRVIGNDPRVLAFLDRLAREVDPAGAVVPGASNAPAAIQSEMATLQKMMGDKNSEYWQGPKSASNQARYRELIDADQKIKSRAA